MQIENQMTYKIVVLSLLIEGKEGKEIGTENGILDNKTIYKILFSACLLSKPAHKQQIRSRRHDTNVKHSYISVFLLQPISNIFFSNI